MNNIKSPLSKRFWRLVEKIAGVDCWIWTGSVSYKGYGMIANVCGDGKYRPTTAHRASWTLHKGPIPDGMFVLHRCDNRLCVNPDHLFLGTAKDNTHDMMRKGRQDISGLIERGNKKRGPDGKWSKTCT